MNFKKITDTSFKVNSQETRTMSGAAVVNFEHILHFILLLILLNKLMQVGPEKRQFQAIIVFSVTVRNIVQRARKICYGICFYLYSLNEKINFLDITTERYIKPCFISSVNPDKGRGAFRVFFAFPSCYM